MRLAIVLVIACGGRAPAPEPMKSLQLNASGAMVDVGAAVVPGYVTIVDFWSESCGACTVVGGMLAVGVAHEPRVIVRKIDVGDGFSPVAHAYSIGALPHYDVYDRERRLRYVLVGNDCLKAADLARKLVAE